MKAGEGGRKKRGRVQERGGGGRGEEGIRRERERGGDRLGGGRGEDLLAAVKQERKRV